MYSGPYGKADLTCIVKAQPRANVSETIFYYRNHISHTKGLLVLSKSATAKNRKKIESTQQYHKADWTVAFSLNLEALNVFRSYFVFFP